MTRAQCLVYRGKQVLMVKHRMDNEEWWCLPGGGIEPEETALDAALRELREECCVTGRVIRQVSFYTDDAGINLITYLVDIGDQQPHMGADPELAHEQQILSDVRWLTLAEITERDRAYLWAAGLLNIPIFREEASSWGDELSYPVG